MPLFAKNQELQAYFDRANRELYPFDQPFRWHYWRIEVDPDPEPEFAIGLEELISVIIPIIAAAILLAEITEYLYHNDYLYTPPSPHFPG